MLLLWARSDGGYSSCAPTHPMIRGLAKVGSLQSGTGLPAKIELTAELRLRGFEPPYDSVKQKLAPRFAGIEEVAQTKVARDFARQIGMFMCMRAQAAFSSGGHFALLHAVAREVLADVHLDCLCRRDVGISISCVALLELGKSASIERTRQLRVESQRRAIIVDG
jgi:hypothetical protein